VSELVGIDRIVDFIIAASLVEALALIAYHRMTGRGLATAELLATLGAGLGLLLALRLALAGSWWGWIALALLAALAAHLVDLARRWR
jgi:hypothetical protein